MRISLRGLFLFFLFVCLVIYSGSLSGGFVLDDYPLIVDNADIKSAAGIPRIFTSHIFKFSLSGPDISYSYYRPAIMLLFSLQYRLWGLNPFGYHAFNIFLHALNAFLVFYFLLRLFSDRRLALFSSVLFCVHPLQTGAVSNVSSLTDLTVTFFILATLIFYIRYAQSRKGAWYILSLCSFISGILSREATFFLFVPLALFFIDRRAGRNRSSALGGSLAFLGVFILYLAFRMTLLVPLGALPAGREGFLSGVLNFANVIAGYIKLFIFPRCLHVFRSIAPVDLSRPSSVIAPAILLPAAVISVYLAAMRRKYALLFGMGWFVLSLSSLLFFMHKLPGHIMMEEHWAYLPSIGFFVILSSVLLSIRNKALAYALIIPAIIAYSLLTFINSRHWKDELTFYHYNLKLIAPDLSILPRMNFATVLYKRGFYAEALKENEIILNRDRDNWLAYVQRGDVFMAMKKFPEAEEAYRGALKIDYFCWQANRRLMRLAEESGRAYRDEVRPGLSPEETKIVLLIRRGDFNLALQELEQALSSDSPTPQFFTLAGITFGKMGRYAQAREAFQAALNIDKDYYPALENLAVLYGNKNKR